MDKCKHPELNSSDLKKDVSLNLKNSKYARREQSMKATKISDEQKNLVHEIFKRDLQIRFINGRGFEVSLDEKEVIGYLEGTLKSEEIEASAYGVPVELFLEWVDWSNNGHGCQALTKAGSLCRAFVESCGLMPDDFKEKAWCTKHNPNL